MKLSLLVLLFCMIFSTLSAKVWIGLEKANRKKENPGYCFETIHKIGPLDKGQKKRIDGMCAEATCLENKNVKFSGCPIVYIKPPCYVVGGNLSKPYPECCFEIKCKENNATAKT